MADGFITVHIDLRGTKTIEALARLYSVCRRMEAERTSDPPTDEEYRAAMLAAALALRRDRRAARSAVKALRDPIAMRGVIARQQRVRAGSDDPT